MAVLTVLDDLTFGPFFWLLSRAAGPAWAVLAVYAVYVPAHLEMVRQGTAARPHRAVAWLLSRYDLQRRSRHVARNEAHLRSRVVGAGSAVALSLVIGGALPALLLWRQGFDRRFVRRLSVVTSVLYATEYALLHGLLPSLL